MLILQSIILGIVQGLSEFLPISSSAHLIILPWLFNWNDPALDSLSFDVALHLGTLFAIIIFFWKDWVRIIGAWFRSIVDRKIGDDPDRKIGWLMILATIPGGLAGVAFEHKVTTSFHVFPIPQLSMLLMAGVVALLGALLWIADSLAPKDKPIGKVGLKDAILIGCAQALAIFPGVSRSGATITAGRALGLDRPSAARFSFLLSAPIIAGSGFVSLIEILHGAQSGALTGVELTIFPFGIIAAAVSGLLCIKFLMGYLQKHSLKGFGIYRFALAAVILAVALVRGA